MLQEYRTLVDLNIHESSARLYFLNKSFHLTYPKLHLSQMHHDPKPKDSDSEDDASVERKKPEGSWFPSQREKGLNTSEVSYVRTSVLYISAYCSRKLIELMPFDSSGEG